MPENEKSDYAQIFVQLDPKITSADKLILIEKIRHIFVGYPGARIEVKNFEQGAQIIAPVEVRLEGDNLDSLRQIAKRVENLLSKTPGTMYVKNPVTNLKSDIKLYIDKEKANSLGIQL
jgi:multidrug efflux pump subunit AcrB